MSKVTAEMIAEGRRLIDLGVSHDEIGKTLGVSHSTVLHYCGKSVARSINLIRCRQCRQVKNRSQFARTNWRVKLCASCADANKASARLRYLYSITMDDYKAMLDSQNGKCAICQTNDPSAGRKTSIRFSVDHDHDSMRIRGLLCHRCNGVLGLADERIEVLESAIAYLKRHEQVTEDRQANAVKGCE